MNDLEYKRREVLVRWDGIRKSRNHVFPQFINFWQEIFDNVEYYRKNAAYMRPADIQLLRDLEAGAALYDADDDTYRHTFTYFDSITNRVHLRDSGYVLLYAIDCDFEKFRLEMQPLIEQIDREERPKWREQHYGDKTQTKRGKGKRKRAPVQMALLETETA